MIKRNNKKGFTIVELVIVIAVIAILAAVLIPTFAGIIRKANISADTQLVKNMNTALAADEAINGPAEDFNDVIAIVRDAGYILSAFNPTTEGCYVVWESDSNQLLLVDGKKGLAERIVYTALEGVSAKNGQDAVVTLKKALDNVRPTLEVRSRRVGGSTYQVPIEVKPHRANTLALRWLTSYAKGRREKTMTERLMNEILDASNGLGAAVKRREDTHKMAESNKAFAHYRW